MHYSNADLKKSCIDLNFELHVNSNTLLSSPSSMSRRQINKILVLKKDKIFNTKHF